jgi:hypothetical protein
MDTIKAYSTVPSMTHGYIQSLVQNSVSVTFGYVQRLFQNSVSDRVHSLPLPEFHLWHMGMLKTSSIIPYVTHGHIQSLLQKSVSVTSGYIQSTFWDCGGDAWISLWDGMLIGCICMVLYWGFYFLQLSICTLYKIFLSFPCRQDLALSAMFDASLNTRSLPAELHVTYHAPSANDMYLFLMHF